MARFNKVVLVLALAFISININAKSVFTIEKSDLRSGLLQLAIIKDEKKLELVKNTTLFDGIQALGVFEIINSKDIAKEVNELERLYSVLSDIENKLGKLETESNGFKHQRYFNLGKFKIEANDSYFEKVNGLFSNILKSIKTKQISGISLEKNKSDKLILKSFNSSKSQKSKEVSKASICEIIKNSFEVCTIKSQGTLYFPLQINKKKIETH